MRGHVSNLKTDNLRVLIVDDDLSTRRLLACFIARACSCQIREAEDGLEALTLLLRERVAVDLIILDIRMRHVNGLDFLRILRSKHKFQDLPVIVCSSVTDSQEVREILQYGVDGYVIKPIDKQLFIQRIGQALGRNRLHIFPPTLETL